MLLSLNLPLSLSLTHTCAHTHTHSHRQTKTESVSQTAGRHIWPGLCNLVSTQLYDHMIDRSKNTHTHTHAHTHRHTPTSVQLRGEIYSLNRQNARARHLVRGRQEKTDDEQLHLFATSQKNFFYTSSMCTKLLFCIVHYSPIMQQWWRKYKPLTLYISKSTNKYSSKGNFSTLVKFSKYLLLNMLKV